MERIRNLIATFVSVMAVIQNSAIVKGEPRIGSSNYYHIVIQAQDNASAPNGEGATNRAYAASGDAAAGLPHTPGSFVSSANFYGREVFVWNFYGGEVFVWNGHVVDFPRSAPPDANNRPHMISSNVMAYTDAHGVAQQVTLKPLPAPGSTFGTAANGHPNNGAYYDPRGWVNVTVDGTVLDGYDFNGVSINVQANNVTIKNFRLSGGLYGINIDYRQNVTGTVIEDGEMYGSSKCAIYGHDFIAKRLNIHGEGQDGINASGNNGTVEDSYIHHLGTDPTAHADGVQISGGTNWLIKDNNFDMPENDSGSVSNSCVFLESYFRLTSNVTINGNWCNGGNYSIYSRGNGRYGTPHGVQIINNFFGHDYSYGLLSADPNAVIVWQNNRWVDTNGLIPSPLGGS
jgi:hypothetical protein